MASQLDASAGYARAGIEADVRHGLWRTARDGGTHMMATFHRNTSPERVFVEDPLSPLPFALCSPKKAGSRGVTHRTGTPATDGGACRAQDRSVSTTLAVSLRKGEDIDNAPAHGACSERLIGLPRKLEVRGVPRHLDPRTRRWDPRCSRNWAFMVPQAPLAELQNHDYGMRKAIATPRRRSDDAAPGVPDLRRRLSWSGHVSRAPRISSVEAD